jgi:hypothetical protein
VTIRALTGRSAVSVCSVVAAAPQRAAAALSLLRPAADEIVVAVDPGTDPALLAGIADRLYRVEYEPPRERYLAWLHSLCSGDWILWLDEDEVPSAALVESLPVLTEKRDALQLRLQRRWLFPDAQHWLGDGEWGPEYTTRLVRNDPATLRFTRREPSADPALPARYVDAPIYRSTLLDRAADEPREETKLRETPTADRELIERVLGAVSPPTTAGPQPIDVPRREVDRHWAHREFDGGGYLVELRCLEREVKLTVGRPGEVDVTVRNAGTETLPWGGGPPPIRIAYHWLGPAGEIVDYDGHRTPLPANIRPGTESIVPVHVAPPATPGNYLLEFDLVHEGVRWFEQPDRVPATVSGPVRRARIPAALLQARAKVVCVTGMHRSGTSVVTRMLNLLGVYLGEPNDLVPPARDNLDGFWERRDVVALNDEVLALAGGAAIAPPLLAAGWEADAAFDPLRARARELLAGWVHGRPVVGWKDPRTSLTLPFWRTVVPVDATVLAIRHPLEVARSLGERNGTGEAAAARLYVTYVVSALLNDPQAVIVRYSELFANPGAAAARLADELALSVPPDAHAQARGVVKDALRNARLEHLPGEGASAIAVSVYERLSAGERERVLRVADELLYWAIRPEARP